MSLFSPIDETDSEVIATIHIIGASLVDGLALVHIGPQPCAKLRFSGLADSRI